MSPSAVGRVNSRVTCFHCGDPVTGEGVTDDDKHFCCAGCRSVYDILRRNEMCDYYSLENAPGKTPVAAPENQFSHLDNPEIAARFIEFSDGATSTVRLHIPGIHCSSCIWLLEQLDRIEKGVLFSRVDFPRKQILVRFSPTQTSLRSIVELLARLGYSPDLAIESVAGTRDTRSADRPLMMKIGIAAFCFANIMLFSFPEYLSGGALSPEMKRMFGYMNLLLSLPVLLYSASDYFRSAVGGLKRKLLTIDVPIALGLSIIFLRSVFDIFFAAGPGYSDSMTGLVFFLLIGRMFQNKTYAGLNFERTYASYFPLAVDVLINGEEKTTPVAHLRPRDRIVIRHGEIIPTDAVLMRGVARVDYSFITGESFPSEINVGAIIFAGGRQLGGLIELEVVKEASSGYLAHLWTEFHKGREARLTLLANTVARYFTAGVLAIATAVALFWLPRNPSLALDAVTAALIVACPCALALATPFAYGMAMRIMGRNGFFLKGVHVVETLSRVNAIVFDKTGTIAHAGRARFDGQALSGYETRLVASLALQSSHPLSREIAPMLGGQSMLPVSAFKEIPGEGIEGEVDGHRVRLGSASFVSAQAPHANLSQEDHSVVAAGIDGAFRGRFLVGNHYREGIDEVIRQLRNRFPLLLLSGDNASERGKMEELFGPSTDLRFHQSPRDKVSVVRTLREKGQVVAMVGDGLNDAAALDESDVGIAVAENPGTFSPASDAIVTGTELPLLDRFLRFARSTRRVVVAGFGISLLYNIVGIGFAAQGLLSPLVAAILMPLSSITVVTWCTLAVRALGRRKGLL
jgi:P-type Cu+ transporter